MFGSVRQRSGLQLTGQWEDDDVSIKGGPAITNIDQREPTESRFPAIIYVKVMYGNQLS